MKEIIGHPEPIGHAARRGARRNHRLEQPKLADPLRRGRPNGSANHSEVSNAANNTGCRPGLSILLLDTKSDNPNHYIVISILQEIRRDARVSRVDKADYACAVRMAQSVHYDILLALDGEAINIDVLARLKALVGTSVLWAWEDPYERTRTVSLASLFDHIFSNDVGSIAFYPGGAHHLPLAAADFLPLRETNAEYTYDLSFVGSAWPNRVVLLRRLLRELPDLRTRFVLSYNPYLPKSYLDLPESNYAGAISHHDFLDIANRSRVCLTLDRNFSGDGLHPRARSAGPRLFETAMAGGYQLVDASAVEVDRCFVPGKEIDTFITFSECVEKIRDALDKPQRRIAMARAAQLRSKADHSYANRVDVIFNVVTQATPRPAARACQSALPQARRRPRLLFVTHNTIAAGNFGGVEVYQETIADRLRERYDILYYRPAQPAVRDGQREYVLTDSRHNIIDSFTVQDFDVVKTLTEPAAEAAFARIVTEQAIELVHFHHLINHCPSLPIIARILGVPSVYTLQDFWPVCTRFNLIDHRGAYCGIADRPKVVCDACLKSASGIEAGAQDYRRSFFNKVLASYDRILGNSPTATSICRKIYPDLPAERFVALGLPVPWTGPNAVTPRGEASRRNEASLEANSAAPLNVVFLGNFSRIKGAESFIEAAGILRNDNMAFTICGRIDEPYGALLREADLANVTVEGAFAPGKLNLTRFDVSLHLSIWPETYCITLSEAWMAGVVPIVTGCGALADRVTDQHDGYHVPINGAGELVALLRRLEADRQELADRRARIAGHLWLTPQQHCDTLGAIYAELIAAYPQPRGLNLPAVATGAPTDFSLSGQSLTPPDWTRPDNVSLPAPPDNLDQRLAPLARQLGLVKAALDQGRIELSHALHWHLDAIGCSRDLRASHISSDWAAMNVTSLSPMPLQLFGWLRLTGAPPSNLMLAVRAASGDLILRPVYLHDRPDLQIGGAAAFGIGFATDPFPPQMLAEGVYGLEFVHLREATLDVVPLAALLVTPNGIPHLTGPGQAIVRVPLPGAAWGNVARVSNRLVGVLDDIDILPATINDPAAPAILVLNGWALDERGHAAGAPALQLSGSANFHASLTTVTRIDVLQALNLRDIGATGYEAAVCLSDLPAGAYSLELVKRLPAGIAKLKLADLHIEPGGGKIGVERCPEPADLREAVAA